MESVLFILASLLASLWMSLIFFGPSLFLLSLHPLLRRSTRSLSMNRWRMSSLSLTDSISILLKYTSIISDVLIVWPSLPLISLVDASIGRPTVLIKRQSTSMSSGLGSTVSSSSCLTHVCITASMRTPNLYSWPTNIMLPSILFLAVCSFWISSLS